MKNFLILLIALFACVGCSNDETNTEYTGKTLSVSDDEYKWDASKKRNFFMQIQDMFVPKQIVDVEIDSNEPIDETANEPYVVTGENAAKPEEKYIPPVNLLGSYSTKILTNDSNRYNNISIVADRLNGYVLAPGEEFSYNKVCGPYGQDDGFLEANILLSDGTEVKGFGGGVCQLSTTLYNAVKDLKVDITEHHHHSKPVAYVPVNQDATVSLQSNLDFKFKNNYDKSIRFETWRDPNNLSVSVYLQ